MSKLCAVWLASSILVTGTDSVGEDSVHIDSILRETYIRVSASKSYLGNMQKCVIDHPSYQILYHLILKNQPDIEVCNLGKTGL